MLTIIQGAFLLPFPVVVHTTKVSIPNPTELLLLTLKVYTLSVKLSFYYTNIIMCSSGTVM